MQAVMSKIASAQGGWEPQRQNNFLLSFEPDGVDLSMIQFALSQFPFPEINTVTKTTPWVNQVRKWAAGPVEYPSVTLQLFDYVDKGVARAVEQWHNLVWTPGDGKIHLAAQYKCQGSLIMFAPDMTAHRREWTLHGCYPRGFKHGDWNMASGDQVIVSVNLEIDWITPVTLYQSSAG